MKTKKSYSLTRRISWVIVLLFGATVLLSFVLMGFFYRASYRETVSNYQKIASDDALAASRMLQTANDQMNWIASETKKISDITDTDPYERVLVHSSVTNSIGDAQRVSQVMDAIVIIPRNSDLILEAHSMEEDRFVDFLDVCTGRRAYLGPAVSFLTDDGTGDVTHMMLLAQVKDLDINSMFALTTASVFATVPTDRLIGQISSGNRQILCYERDNALLPIASRGIEASLPQTLPGNMKDGDDLELGGERYLVISAPVDGYDFRLLMLVKHSELLDRMYAVVAVVLAVVGALLGLTVLGIRFTSQWIHMPINKLVRDIRHVNDGDGDARLRDSAAEEITEISRSVNRMLEELLRRSEQIRQTQENVRELQLLHKDSQLRALQSQINPHFLYNTLECVRSIAFAYRVEEISDILDSIILIYRYSASDASEGTVRSEFDCCGSYANVIGYRFRGKYQVQMEIQPGVEDTPLPRMVLQPLLENAINHGYAKTDRGAMVEITACEEADGSVLIRVLDHGCGISPQALESLRQEIYAEDTPEDADSIGLRNVHRRIHRTFGEGYGLSLDSREGEFTEVSLRVPQKAKGAQE